MKQITTAKGTYLFVEVPNNAYDFSLTKYKTHCVINYFDKLKDGTKYSCSDNIGGLNKTLLDYQIISTTNQITEEQAEIICPSIQGYGYRNFTQSDYNGGSSPFDVWIPYSCKTVKESLQSLIKANGLDEAKNYIILKKKL